MLNLKRITADEHQKAVDQPIRMPRKFLPVNSAPYFVDYVRQQLHELYSPEVLQSEGLSVYTTLHPEMAFAAEAAVKEGLEELDRLSTGESAGESKEPLQAALIAVQPRTGAVMALVGGRDYSESSFSRAIHAHRQSGSAIKPFVYLSALEDHPISSLLPDEGRTYMVEEGPWIPVNYDRKYRGMVTMRTALEESLNAATVNLAMEIGLERVIQTLRGLGIQSPLKPLPSLALGAFEVSPLELAAAYAVFGNDGQKPHLLSLKEVVSDSGAVQERRTMEMISVTSPAKAYLITNMLEGVVDRGTATNLRGLGIDFKCAGKTGTTSDYRDSWFVGYTTDLLVLVWVGYDDNRSTGLTGAKGASLIWAHYLNRVRPWIHPQPFRIPPGVVQRIVCAESGSLSDLRCPKKHLESFLTELAPNDYCSLHGRQ
jgi:penicillin-binding protein 1B